MYERLLFIGFLLIYEIQVAFATNCPDMNFATTDSVDITEDCTLAGEISIPKTYTINGNGHTINAAANKRHFTIDSTEGSGVTTNAWTITINDAILEGGLPRSWIGLPTGYATDNEGGSIYIKDYNTQNPIDKFTTLKLSNVTFRHNRARLDGSVLFLENGGLLDLHNVIFEDNYIEREVDSNDAMAGSVIEYKSYAGEQEQKFHNVQFSNNKVCNGTICDSCCNAATDVFVILKDDTSSGDATERIDLGFYDTNIDKLEVYSNTVITTKYNLRQVNSLIGTIVETMNGGTLPGHNDKYESCTVGTNKLTCPVTSIRLGACSGGGYNTKVDCEAPGQCTGGTTTTKADCEADSTCVGTSCAYTWTETNTWTVSGTCNDAKATTQLDCSQTFDNTANGGTTTTDRVWTVSGTCNDNTVALQTGCTGTYDHDSDGGTDEVDRVWTDTSSCNDASQTTAAGCSTTFDNSAGGGSATENRAWTDTSSCDALGSCSNATHATEAACIADGTCEDDTSTDKDTCVAEMTCGADSNAACTWTSTNTWTAYDSETKCLETDGSCSGGGHITKTTCVGDSNCGPCSYTWGSVYTWSVHGACISRTDQGIFCYAVCDDTNGFGREEDAVDFDFDDPCRTCTVFENAANGICNVDGTTSCTAGKGLEAVSNILNDATCVDCAEGYYAAADDRLCLECGDGHTVFDDAMAIVTTAATQCIECDNATEWDHDGEPVTACISLTGRCNRGFEILITPSDEDSNYCLACRNGEYQLQDDTTDQCVPWATTHANCTAQSGFYMPGNRVKDAECHFTENDNTIFHYFEPSDVTFDLADVFCFPNTFKYMDPSTGQISCRSCDPTLFLNSYRISTMDLIRANRKGGCCYNPHHHVCRTIMKAFKDACGGNGNKGEVKKCDQ